MPQLKPLKRRWTRARYNARLDRRWFRKTYGCSRQMYFSGLAERMRRAERPQ